MSKLSKKNMLMWVLPAASLHKFWARIGDSLNCCRARQQEAESDWGGSPGGNAVALSSQTSVIVTADFDDTAVCVEVSYAKLTGALFENEEIGMLLAANSNEHQRTWMQTEDQQWHSDDGFVAAIGTTEPIGDEVWSSFRFCQAPLWRPVSHAPELQSAVQTSRPPAPLVRWSSLQPIRHLPFTGSNLMEAIFHEALQQPDLESRKRYIALACVDDEPLRRGLEKLLYSHEEAETRFLSRPALYEPAREPLEVQLARLKPEEAGEQISDYKLIEKIGEGGFGTVWLAEQRSPIRRQVALKILKIGMDTKEIIGRFEQERQAVAMMDHPNIAKVFDAGATQYGRPFFVMELVRGVRITDYCDENCLPTSERLRLFIAVCQAVQHAHQKGIIHRDIKPSNILVTTNDEEAIPKVIDFGIAKATEHKRLTDLTIYTKLEQMIGTPLYMSPEQVEKGGVNVDTRSDIYSLGVLLYELLTGRTPFNREELAKAGYDEMRRVIREQEPMKPSTALRMLVGDAMIKASNQRRSDPRKLVRLVQGDLDWIVMKALDKKQSRRYETASSLASDIRRYLISLPVIARPPSAIYRFKKLVRRSKLTFATLGAVAVAILAGTALSAWRAARTESRAAEKVAAEATARANAEAVTKFLVEALQNSNSSGDIRTLTVGEALSHAGQKLDRDFTNEPERRARLQAVLGSIYLSAGLSAEAVSFLEKSRDYYLGTRGLENMDTLRAMQNMATAYDKDGRRMESLKLREQILRIYRRISPHNVTEMIVAMQALADSYSATGLLVEAKALRGELDAIEVSSGNGASGDKLPLR